MPSRSMRWAGHKDRRLKRPTPPFSSARNSRPQSAQVGRPQQRESKPQVVNAPLHSSMDVRSPREAFSPDERTTASTEAFLRAALPNRAPSYPPAESRDVALPASQVRRPHSAPAGGRHRPEVAPSPAEQAIA